MEENRAAQNAEATQNSSSSWDWDSPSSIVSLITCTNAERPQPIWLVHHRYRGMDRKSRSNLIAKEAEERRQLLAERQSSMLTNLPPQMNFERPMDMDGSERVIYTTGNSADDDFVEEIQRLVSRSGVLPVRQEVVRLEDLDEELQLQLQTSRSLMTVEVFRAPELPLPTLLKFYKNLEAYQKFPVHTFSAEPVLVDPKNEHIQCIIREMECPVCTNTCFPPINTCVNGHLVCADCKIRIFDQPKHLPELLGVTSPTCPTCRDAGGMEYVLPGVLAKSMSVIEFKCLNHEAGCSIILNGLNYLKHVQEECTYRRWKCPYCVELLDLRTAGIHFLKVHERTNLGYARWLPSRCIDISRHTRVRFDVPMRGEEIETCFGLFHVIKYDKTFLVFQIRTGVLEFAWFVCLIGTLVESRTYRVDVSLEVEYDMGYLLPAEVKNREWKDIQVFSCQDEMRKIIENVGLTYSDAQMPFNNFCYPGGRAERCVGRMQINFKKIYR